MILLLNLNIPRLKTEQIYTSRQTAKAPGSVCQPAGLSVTLFCQLLSKYISTHETSQSSLPVAVSMAACWLIPFDSEASRHSTSLRGPSPWLHKSRMTASGGPSATCLKRSMCSLLGHPLRQIDCKITLLNTRNHAILITGTTRKIRRFICRNEASAET